jgi:hypothetical protein
MRKKIICLAVICGLFIGNTCYARLDMQVYFSAKSILLTADKLKHVNAEKKKRAIMLSKDVIGGGMQDIADTIVSMQAAATMQGRPIFCGLPQNASLSGVEVEEIGLDTYERLSPQQKQTSLHASFAQFAVLGLMKRYSCNQEATENYGR